MIRACAIGAAASFLLALVLAWLIRPLALRAGHVDWPGERKRHDHPVPLGGGVAIFWSFVLPLIGALAIGVRTRDAGTLPAAVLGAGLESELAADARRLLAFLAGALLLHLEGLWDDQRPLRPAVKLAVQVAAAAPLVTVLGTGVLPEWLDPVSSAALAILWMVAITNAFNFLDGADGLAATVGALCAILFAASAILTGQAADAFLFSLLIGSLLAFLCFNFPPARLFMGDSGSQVVGFVLAFGSLRLTYFDAGAHLESPWYAVFTPVVVLAIPLYDLVTVVVLRLSHRRSPLLADDQHFLHRLARSGLGPRGILIVIGASTVATGIGGVMLSRLEAWQALLVVVQTAMILAVLALLEIQMVRRERSATGAAASSPESAAPATESRLPTKGASTSRPVEGAPRVGP